MRPSFRFRESPPAGGCGWPVLEATVPSAADLVRIVGPAAWADKVSHMGGR